jgi:uracil-DNA glycosylase
MSFAEQVIDNPPASWEDVFADKYITMSIRHIFAIIEKIGNYVPYNSEIFHAFDLCPLDSVKVVILGQDPYPQILDDGRPKACGLSFGIRQDDTSVPHSLKLIYKELKRSFPKFVIPRHGDLSSLASQGILWLNASLTCVRNESDSHGKLWHSFTIPVLQKLLTLNNKIVFLAFGRNAQKLLERYGIGEVPGVKILETDHPAARRKTETSLYGSGVFEKCNEELMKMGYTPIDWTSICH